MKRKQLPFCLGILFMATLTACSKASKPASEATSNVVQPQTNMQDWESGTSESAQIPNSETDHYTWLCDSLSACPGGASEAGFYRMQNNYDGSGNLLYFDYSSKQIIYLSNQINSSHHGDDDTSYFESVVGGAEALCDNEYVYVVKQTSDVLLRQGDPRGTGFLYRMDLNGQNRKSVKLKAQECINPLNGFASSDGELYMIVLETLDDTNILYHLARTEFESGTLEYLYTFSNDGHPTMIGVCPDGLIFSILGQSTQDLAIWNADSGLTVTNFSLNGKTYFSDSENGTFYFINTDDMSSIYQLDWDTLQGKLLSKVPKKEGYDALYFGSSIRDHHIFVEYESTSDGRTERSALDIRTGEWKAQTLVDQKTDVQIYAWNQNEYLVKLENYKISFQDQMPDGTSFINETTFPHFALIDKSDYWCNEPNYIEFENRLS